MSDALSKQLDCYIINLDRATDRWHRLMMSFGSLDLNLIRFSAVDGQQLSLPHPDYAPFRYRMYHGCRSNTSELACVLSHVGALKMFLASGREHAMICEDDVSACPELVEVTTAALRYRDSWDLLRINGLKRPFSLPYADIGDGYRLGTPLSWLGGAGGYVTNRKAAQRMVRHFIPMRVPADHIMDQNWLMRFTTAVVLPYPLALNETACNSLIVRGDKLSFARYATVLPYRGIMSLGRYGIQWATVCQRWLKPPSMQE